MPESQPSANLDCGDWQPAEVPLDEVDEDILPPLPSGTVEFNTSDGEFSHQPGQEFGGIFSAAGTGHIVRLVLLSDIAIASDTTIRVVGNHPLIFASNSGITIAGTLDAGSDHELPGAGAMNADDECLEEGETTNGDGGEVGGGGGGGGFAGSGGNGGDSEPGSGGPGRRVQDVPSVILGG
ncbi:MAG: hypothetical protein AAGC55_29010, partial [Myxococcota bacterium]